MKPKAKKKKKLAAPVQASSPPIIEKPIEQKRDELKTRTSGVPTLREFVRSKFKHIQPSTEIDLAIIKQVIPVVDEYQNLYPKESYQLAFVLEGKYEQKAGAKRLEELANTLASFDVVGSLYFESKQSQIGGLLALSSETQELLKQAYPQLKIIVGGAEEKERIDKFWLQYKKAINPKLFTFLLLKD